MAKLVVTQSAKAHRPLVKRYSSDSYVSFFNETFSKNPPWQPSQNLLVCVLKF